MLYSYGKCIRQPLHLALCHCPERCHQLLPGHHHAALGHRGGAERGGTEIEKKYQIIVAKKNNIQTECIFFEVVTLCRKFTFYNIAKKLPIVLSILCLLDLLIVF